MYIVDSIYYSLFVSLQCRDGINELQVNGHESFAGVHILGQDRLDLGLRHALHPANNLTPLPLVLGAVRGQVVGALRRHNAKDIASVLLNVPVEKWSCTLESEASEGRIAFCYPTHPPKKHERTPSIWAPGNETTPPLKSGHSDWS